MTKATITKLFVGGVAAVVAGVVLAIIAVIAAFGSNIVEVNGHDVVGVEWSGLTWSILGVLILAGLAMVGGAIAGLVAWIGALLNTVQLEDKTWFVLLLVLGLLSFGLVAMIAYVIAGPDAVGRREGELRVHATW
jgi:hypothetical protein